jgi:nucleotide-binding universal stress UspA family protein
MGDVFANNGSYELHLARVIPFLNTASPDPLRDAAREEAQAYLDRIAKHLEVNGDTHARILTSVIMEIDVADALARMTRAGELVTGATATDGFDLIVMATHGRTGLARMAMGSVTERVLSATVAPALIIRPERLASEAQQAGATANPTTAPESWPALF